MSGDLCEERKVVRSSYMEGRQKAIRGQLVTEEVVEELEGEGERASGMSAFATIALCAKTRAPESSFGRPHPMIPSLHSPQVSCLVSSCSWKMVRLLAVMHRCPFSR